MRRRLVLLVVLILLATAVKALLNQFTDGVNDIFPSRSIDDARQADVYVCSMAATPSRFNIDGQDVTISSAWIEKDNRRGHHFVWIPYRQILPTYRLCITLSNGADGLLPKTGLMLSLDSRNGFALVYPRLLFQRLDSVPQSLTAYILDRDKRSEAIPVTLIRSNQALQPTADRLENSHVTSSTLKFVAKLAVVSGGLVRSR